MPRSALFDDPSLSEHERNRLAQLYEYDILDTARDEDFDSLARLAARICDVPVAQINFIDKDRQWSKSSIGVEMENLPLEISFCNHTIRQEQYLVIPDMVEDDRFKNSPFVSEDPHARFYAGFAIKGDGGYNIGSLCVVDLKPRELTDEEFETLNILKDEVEARLNLRKKNKELEVKNEKLIQTTTFLNNSADLMFRIDPVVYQITDINKEVSGVLGFEQRQMTGQPLSALAPDQSFFRKLNSWSKGDRSELFSTETKFAHKSGKPVWFQVGVSEREGLWYATARNINERKKIEEAHNETLKILQNAQRIAKVGNWEWIPETGELTWSDEIHRIMGTDPASFDVSVDSFLDLIHPEDRHILENAMQRILGGGDIEPYEHRCVLGDGTIKVVTERGEVIRDGNGGLVKVTGILQDITAIKQTEQKLLEMLHEKEIMLGEIHHRVKNNIALMSSMLQLEQFNAPTGDESQLIGNILSRIQSIALVHENLYQSDSFSYVPFGELLTSLADIAVESAGSQNRPHVGVESENVNLNINQAIPFALAVNNLLYNLLCHTPSPVSIRLTEDSSSLHMQMNVETGSNGKTTIADHLNNQILDTLIEQLDADLNIRQNGTGHSVTMTFEKNNLSGSAAGQNFSA